MLASALTPGNVLSTGTGTQFQWLEWSGHATVRGTSGLALHDLRFRCRPEQTNTPMISPVDQQKQLWFSASCKSQLRMSHRLDRVTCTWRNAACSGLALVCCCRGQRIVYELALQELFIAYSGYGGKHINGHVCLSPAEGFPT